MGPHGFLHFMAFFKFRWPGQKKPGDKAAKPSRAPRAESIDVMRRRARHRLIGAAVLVLLGVVGFPMLFDTQPRPIPVDTPIEIPDRNKVAPLVVPAAFAPQAAAPSENATDVGSVAEGEEVIASARAPAKTTVAAPVHAPVPAPAPAIQAKPDTWTEAKVAPKSEVKPEAKPKPESTKPEPKPAPEPRHAPEHKPEPKSVARNDDAARARALLEGRSAQIAAAAPRADEGRFIVQIGAFAEADKARDVRQKLERAGLNTFTQVVDTKGGKRTRVRVGPFEDRGEADKAVARIKALNLPASIQSL